MKNQIIIPIFIAELERESFHLFVKGKLLGKELRLLIDTGASKSVLDSNFISSELNNELTVEESDDITGGLGSSEMKSNYTTVKELIIGDFACENLLVAVLDLSHVNHTYNRIEQPAIHGIIGSDILKKHQAVIDYKKEYLSLTH